MDGILFNRLHNVLGAESFLAGNLVSDAAEGMFVFLQEDNI